MRLTHSVSTTSSQAFCSGAPWSAARPARPRAPTAGLPAGSRAAAARAGPRCGSRSARPRAKRAPPSAVAPGGRPCLPFFRGCGRGATSRSWFRSASSRRFRAAAWPAPGERVGGREGRGAIQPISSRSGPLHATKMASSFRSHAHSPSSSPRSGTDSDRPALYLAALRSHAHSPFSSPRNGTDSDRPTPPPAAARFPRTARAASGCWPAGAAPEPPPTAGHAASGFQWVLRCELWLREKQAHHCPIICAPAAPASAPAGAAARNPPRRRAPASWPPPRRARPAPKLGSPPWAAE